MRRLSPALLLVLITCGCSPHPTGPSPAPGAAATLVGAGDIGLCGSPGPEKTARLLDDIAGTVFTLGDNAYPHGAATDYRDCYAPSWGRHRDRTRPTPGNHEYETSGASGYFEYFGAAAGPSATGYYSYDIGSWHVISLNSEIDVARGGAQEQWLRADLSASRSRCTAAYWHKPRYSSGPHGDNAAMQDIWRTLQDFGVEIVLSGHDHLYERFAPQDALGVLDRARGIRQFVVGTGGAGIYDVAAIRANSESRGGEWGVLELTLRETSYEWTFVPVEPSGFRDAGSDVCH